MRLMPSIMLCCLVLAFNAASVLAMDPASLFARAKPSVVLILASNASKTWVSQGSGFVVGDGQHIVTNNHVVGKATNIMVYSIDGREWKAKLLSRDKEHDMAILGISDPLPPLQVNTSTPQVGQEIMAIGNPQGLEWTLSTGVVSAIRRMDISILNLEPNMMVYQVTAPLSPGSSGCPILDDKGHVIGVATFLVNTGQNLNFAVPSKYFMRIIGGTDAPSGSNVDTGPLSISQESDGTIVIGQ